MKQKTLDFLESHQSETSSKWREEAQYRRDNASWLRQSQQVAVTVLLKMKELGLSPKALAERMNCSQELVAKILKGQEKLSTNTLVRLSLVLETKIIEVEK